MHQPTVRPRLVLPLLLGITLTFTRCQPTTSATTQADSTALNQPATESLPVVQHQPVRVGTFRLTTAATGLVRTSAQSKLHFRAGGTISRITVRNGAVVQAGQLLAQLDNRDQQLALRQAEDQVREAQVQVRRSSLSMVVKTPIQLV